MTSCATRSMAGASCLTQFRLGIQRDLPSGEHGRGRHRVRGSPPLTRVELQALFNAADDNIESVRWGPKKGWGPSFRDVAMVKITCAWS